jgi:hypothetical protein
MNIIYLSEKHYNSKICIIYLVYINKKVRWAKITHDKDEGNEKDNIQE